MLDCDAKKDSHIGAYRYVEGDRVRIGLEGAADGPQYSADAENGN